ncbi:MAG: hypothetical protein ACXWKG_10670 [Limisphaerales bacterium]
MAQRLLTVFSNGSNTIEHGFEENYLNAEDAEIAKIAQQAAMAS